ncbi:virulence-associated protein E [Sphingomonas sp. AP4-R1]|uniref:DUF7146 domain-containing protein n=1 Tax=Sphingomonas sp. AP4-R1 TaxID=2735134 RepID=UPI001493A15A|nr:toprim domain-containing protein [Sphingomonas sp. AP4-R1]QJU59345.1 virulence-associated protein E [Sphingomonas sp. AP4-R1]
MTIKTTFPPVSRDELAARGQNLVRALGGAWHVDRGMCRCPAHLDRTPSLSVRVGETALLFKCFAGCATGAVLRSLDRIDPRALRARAIVPHRPAGSPWSEERIATLWREASAMSGTPAERYLVARGIDQESVALRYAARVPVRLDRELHFRPAMLAAVCEGSRIVALQRSFLDLGRTTLARDLAQPRRMLGKPGQGAVMLASAGPILGLAEGIETALSAMQLLGIPVWATLGAERLARIRLPARLERLVLLPDTDPAGVAACQRAITAYAGRTPSVEVRMPPPPAKDWNDALPTWSTGAGGD